jgi:adhesin transport system outer membrane protein
MKYSNSPYRLLAVLLLPFFLLLSSWIASAQDTAELYPVKSGDNLELIAKQVRPESEIKLEAVTQYLYSNNPSAFSKGRIDRLIVGSELKLPSAAEWADMPRLDASAAALSEYTFQPGGRDRSSVAGGGYEHVAYTQKRPTLEERTNSHSNSELRVNKYTLDEVVLATLKSHPNMQAARNEYLSREQEIRQAKAGYYPTLDAAIGIGYEEVDRPVDINTDLTRHEASLSARQSLFEGFGTRSEVRRQQARTDSAGHNKVATAEDLSLRTSEVYLNLLRQAELLDLARNSLYEHQNIHDQMVLRQRSGVGSQADLDQISARLALAQSNVVVAQNNLIDAKTNFNRVTGFFRSEENLIKPQVKGQLPATIDAAIEFANNLHPTLLSAGSDVQAANAQYEAAESPFWPRLSVEVDKRWDEDINGVKGEDEELIAALRLRYNLFNGGADKARRKQSAYLLEESKDVRNDTKRQVEESLRLSWSSFEGLREQMKYLKVHVRAAEDTRASYLKQFNIGKRTLLDLLNTENEVVGAKRSLVTAQYDLLFSQYRILNGMGTLLTQFEPAQ